MKKKLVLLVCLLALFSANAFAVDYKFDVSVRGNLGLMDTWLFGTTAGGDDYNLRVINYGITLNLDTIFVFESPKAYGFALGVVLGFNQFDQQFKYGSYFSETDVEDGNVGTAEPSVPMQAINAGLMLRFFPANSLSIGVGSVFHFVLNKGSYVIDDYLTTDSEALLNPLFGTVIPEILLELTSTRFFGNFGVDFSVNTGLMLYDGYLSTPALIFSAGATFGFRYRFNPY